MNIYAVVLVFQLNYFSLRSEERKELMLVTSVCLRKMQNSSMRKQTFKMLFPKSSHGYFLVVLNCFCGMIFAIKCVCSLYILQGIIEIERNKKPYDVEMKWHGMR